MIEQVIEQHGTWLFVAPVQGLELTKAVNFEHRVNRVTFVAASKLPYRRQRFGFPIPISELRNRSHSFINRLFDNRKAFLLFRLTGTGSDLTDQFMALAREEIAILALSQLGYGQRKNHSVIGFADEKPLGRFGYLMLNTSQVTWKQSNILAGNPSPLVLSGIWKNFQKTAFYFDLLKIIRNEVQVTNAWRRDIYNAAVLVGQSVMSLDVPQSFLWNMIAIELLLTKQGDKYVNALPERAEAFIGWTYQWHSMDYKSRIREIYKKRSKLVHAGRRDLIEANDVAFTDELLLNLFMNICKHPSIFRSKDDLIEFSEKVKAEHLLGIEGRVRPKTLAFISRPRT